jgi:hypothetical protein
MLSTAYATSNYNLIIPPSSSTGVTSVAALRQASFASMALLAFLINGATHSDPENAVREISPSLPRDKLGFSQLLGSFSANSLLVAVDYETGTPNTILGKLLSLKRAFPGMSAQIADAQRFAAELPIEVATPSVWTDGECEVVFEWISGSKHAVVSFEGDGEFGYTMKHGNRFLPGSFPGNSLSTPPSDLISYLASA